MDNEKRKHRTQLVVQQAVAAILDAGPKTIYADYAGVGDSLTDLDLPLLDKRGTRPEEGKQNANQNSRT